MAEPQLPDLGQIVFEELAVRVDLPVDWELTVDTEHGKLQSVGGDTPWCAARLCPSITLKRTVFEGDTAEFRRTARQSLEEMPGNYEKYSLRWSEDPSPRVALRCYSFWSPTLEQRITQLQGLVEADNDAAVYVVHASAPEETFDELQAMYRHVVLSVVPLGPDYVAPDHDEDAEDASG